MGLFSIYVYHYLAFEKTVISLQHKKYSSKTRYYEKNIYHFEPHFHGSFFKSTGNICRWYPL